VLGDIVADFVEEVMLLKRVAVIESWKLACQKRK
jgi:hypothetical protein